MFFFFFVRPKISAKNPAVPRKSGNKTKIKARYKKSRKQFLLQNCSISWAGAKEDRLGCCATEKQQQQQQQKSTDTTTITTNTQKKNKVPSRKKWATIMAIWITIPTPKIAVDIIFTATGSDCSILQKNNFPGEKKKKKKKVLHHLTPFFKIVIIIIISYSTFYWTKSGENT